MLFLAHESHNSFFEPMLSLLSQSPHSTKLRSTSSSSLPSSTMSKRPPLESRCEQFNQCLYRSIRPPCVLRCPQIEGYDRFFWPFTPLLDGVRIKFVVTDSDEARVTAMVMAMLCDLCFILQWTSRNCGSVLGYLLPPARCFIFRRSRLAFGQPTVDASSPLRW